MKASDDRTVSVVMSAYNHAPYVGSAIESVLSQTHGDIEFLITDDGSSDGTVEEIAKYRDPRIVFVPSAVNRGACAAINELISKAVGRYVCVMNSDDVWCSPRKLEGQLSFLQDRPEVGATFGQARYIDDEGNELKKSLLHDVGVFEQGNRSRQAWLEQLFMEGNCLCHPTVMIRRECYEQLGKYRNILRQLPDYDMWIRLAKHYEISVSSEELVCFRILPGLNASSPSRANIIRDINENYLIRRKFLNGVTDEDFRTGFHQHFVQYDASDTISLEIEKALIYFNEKSRYQAIDRIIGLERLEDLLINPDISRVLKYNYQIDDQWFHMKMAGVKSLFRDQSNAECRMPLHHNLGIFKKGLNYLKSTFQNNIK
jgi:glycosyltransferase involved in cell wall biosynthesis